MKDDREQTITEIRETLERAVKCSTLTNQHAIRQDCWNDTFT